MSTAEKPPAPASFSASGALTGVEAWRRLAETNLNGRSIDTLRSQTRDGIPIELLYTRSRHASPIMRRSAGKWLIVQAIDDADPDKANERALAAIKGGANGLALRFSSARGGMEQGLPLSSEALHAALDGIDLDAISLRLEPHEDGVRIAKWADEMIVASGLAPERADVAFGLDPVMVVAAEIRPDAELFAARFVALGHASFRGPFALLDGRNFHEAGATEAQELAAILGSAAWWLRTLEAAKVAPDAALPFLGAAVSVDQDVLVSIAKLRALRLLWSRLEELCGAPRTALQIHAETSRRMLTRTELTDNLLRNTLAAFAAAVGGADSISIAPHIAAIGISDRNARALARNIQHLLMEESDLHRVGDLAAGSGAIEALTEGLAERAWAEFRVIEGEGGIVESLRAGQFQARVARTTGVGANRKAEGRA